MPDWNNPCVFCLITSGDVSASVVAEDDRVIAFMDHRQHREGHVLVVPRVHVPDVFSLDLDTAAHMARVVVRVAHAVRRAFRPDGLNVYQNNGAAAGQVVFHLHTHVTARWSGDNLFTVYLEPPPISPQDELDRQAAVVRECLSALELG